MGQVRAISVWTEMIEITERNRTMAKKTSKKGANTPTKTTEAKAAKFVELAQKRTTKAINSVRSIAKLSSTNYVYTDEQVKKICETLRQEVVALNEAFSRKTGTTKESFTL
jgi:hypothetical protein